MTNMKSLFTILLLAIISGSSAAGNLKPFKSDGCSLFPDGTLEQKNLWKQCCVAHDLAYWAGGTHAERILADESLKECVAKVGEPGIAQLMLTGVRIGGVPQLPTTFRWGFGWPYPREYGPLSEEEKAAVNEALKEASR